MNKINKIKLSILILAMVVISATALGQIEHKPIKKNFNAVYGKYYQGDAIQLSQEDEAPVYNYTFYLPYPAYVYVETTGELYMKPDVFAGIGLSVDNPYIYDPGTDRWTENDGIEDFGTIFHTSRVYRLTPGKHTIYLFGWTGDVGEVATVSYMSINAIASSNGELVEDRQWMPIKDMR